MKNSSCSVQAACVLLACKPEVIEMALDNRNLVEVLYQRIESLESQIKERDKNILDIANGLKSLISK